MRAPDVPKKPAVEKTSTITSSTQSMSSSWGEKSIGKKIDPSLNFLTPSYAEIPNKRPRTLTTWSKKLDASPMPSTEESSSECTKSIRSSNSKNGSNSCLSDSHQISLLTQQIGRYFTPVRLTESSSIFRPSSTSSSTPKLKDDPALMSATCNGGDFDFKVSTEPKEDHLSEVLDLSKKEPLKVKLEEAKVKDDKNGILVECC